MADALGRRDVMPKTEVHTLPGPGFLVCWWDDLDELHMTFVSGPDYGDVSKRMVDTLLERGCKVRVFASVLMFEVWPRSGAGQIDMLPRRIIDDYKPAIGKILDVQIGGGGLQTSPRRPVKETGEELIRKMGAPKAPWER